MKSKKKEIRKIYKERIIKMVNNLAVFFTGRKYRVAWRNYLTGTTGHGKWVKHSYTAETWKDFGNESEEHIIHWIETR